ncbi:MAG TPA: cytochrome ubiquinol oxidase subunit I [Kofleriaceae bacterium]|nr:cytochrome ubiquinol oxidase subunit I [Kofleriaceae bacterium]
MSAPTTELLFARGQMAYSLAFHIVFAAVGIAMPVLMVAAEALWRRTGDAIHLDLARRWAKGTAVLFAVGAVSGTVLSFELGLLFPRFMEHAGAIIGLPFSLEGVAFFTEAIFLGLYLYGWDRLRPSVHMLCGVLVAVSGIASAAFVTIANAWMNAPTGFRLEDGKLVDIDPIAAMATPFALHEVLHTILAAFMATALAVAAIHAWALLRGTNTRLHRNALALALALGIPSALAQPIVGHMAGQMVARHQPLKLAAMEGLEKTTAGAPLHLGPIEIPGMLSWLAFGDTDATVIGLEEFPAADRPHSIVRVAYQVMIGLGSAAAAYAIITLLLVWRRRGLPDSRWWLRITVLLGPAGVIAMEAGWTVTEVGRQPWTIYGILRTADAATPVGGLWLPFTLFALVYLGLAVVVVAVLIHQVRQTTEPPGAG